MSVLWTKIGLVAHALCAGTLAGASTHFAITVWRARAGKNNPRLLRLYPSVVMATYVLLFAIGTAIYPRYRVEVRAEWLDTHARWAAILFDVKENFAVLLGPFVLAAWLSTRPPRDVARPHIVLTVSAYTVASVVWFNLIAGLLVVSVRSL
jgi:hypothetical protein